MGVPDDIDINYPYADEPKGDLKFSPAYQRWCLNRRIHDRLVVGELYTAQHFSNRVASLRLEAIASEADMETGNG